MDIIRTVSEKKQQAYVYEPGEGKLVAARSVKLFIKTSGQETNGYWALMEYNAPAHFDFLSRYKKLSTSLKP